MLELKTGEASHEEIAEWFGLSTLSFLNHKQMYLNKLKAYCDFTPVPRKGVIINKIFNADNVTYNKNKVYRKVKAEFFNYWKLNTLDTAARVGRTMRDELFPKLTDETVIKYVRMVKNEFFGKCEKLNQMAFGTIGRSVRIWVKRENETYKYLFLTEEEQNYKREMVTKLCNEYRLTNDMVDNSLDSDDKTIIENLGIKKHFTRILESFKKKYNGILVQGTLIDRHGKKIFRDDDGNEYEIANA